MVHIDINEMIKELELPKNTKFLGFVVHLPESDEFLAFIKEESEYMELRSFSKTPDYARTFKEYEDALSASKSCNQKAIVAILLDIEKQWLVISYDEWISG